MKTFKKSSTFNESDKIDQNLKLIYKTTTAYKRKLCLKDIITNPFKKYKKGKVQFKSID